MSHGANLGLFEVEVPYHRTREFEEPFGILAKHRQAPAALENLNQPAETHRPKDGLRCLARLLPGLDNFVARDALGPRQARVHRQRPPKQDDEEHADQPAGQQNEAGFPVVVAQIGPDPLPADIGQQKRRDGEDCASHQRFAYRRRRARDVLFEYRPPEPRQPEERHRDHRRRNRRRHRRPGTHAQIRVGRPKQEG